MPELQSIDHLALARRGRRLEYFTILWNVLEGTVAIVAGAVAGSVSLMGFGIENDMFSKYRTPAYIAYQRRDYEETLKGIRLAQQLGVQLLAGTDVVAPYTYPGFSLHDELGLLVEAGLTPLQSLQTATVNPAQFLGIRDMGTIAPGMKANLVLLDANPAENIANTKKISSVIMGGMLCTRNQLDDLLNSSAKIASIQK